VNDGSVWWMPAWSPDGKNIICSVFSSSDTLASAIGMNIRSPSFRAGMNSDPSRVASTHAPAKID